MEFITIINCQNMKYAISHIKDTSINHKYNA